MNTELLGLIGQVAGKCVIVMIFIALACIVTPRLARWIEKRNPDMAEKIEEGRLFGGEDPERVEDNAKGRIPDEEYEAHSAFEASKIEDFDPNYKIYNTDIYGVELKNGKKQKNG